MNQPPLKPGAEQPVRFVEREDCPVCHSANLSPIMVCDFADDPIATNLRNYYGRDPERLRGWKFDLEQCARCECLFQRWIGDEAFLEELYTYWIEGHITDDPDSYAPWRKILAEPGRSRDGHEVMMAAARLGRPVEGLKTLDYGMGFGTWARVALALGADSHGFDLSPTCVAYARGKGVRIASQEDLDRGGNGFDFINTEQVFEHIGNPGAEARRLTANLRPGGLLKVSVPSGIGMVERVRRGLWDAAKYSRDSLNAVQPLEHINAFTPRTMAELGRLAGLERIDMPYRHRFAFLRHKGATPLSPRPLGVSLLRPWYRFNNAQSLYYWYRKPA
ncbi:MAG TPA: class I SAM-dependent methyltransferase [Allosphingosinicella sp.]|nr:class I SAM-dependent methyltransferase [Allosphingosinicella sp.]